ncbi:MAG: MoCo/4Fe-4S cofactor protein with predicted Tat translocation signal [Saprospiraceae bacterium]|jgi:MoCo/4Fe-4S cofactor protein with predicted Tat translocation signal
MDMKNNNQDVWVGIEDKNHDPSFLENINSEFKELPIIDTLSTEESMEIGASRRDFLKYLGFGIGAATLAAGCEIPIKRAIPYVTKPDTIVPGVANYYASSFVKGGDYCAVLVKTREGRPIKIEGNSMSPVTGGGTSARVQASVLDLYDVNRLQGPAVRGENGTTKTSWADLDNAVKGKLSAGSKVRIVSNTILSPTSKNAIADFTASFANTKLVTYDAVSSSAMLEANESSFGEKVIPNYSFDKADVIVSIGADFLGTWISPIEYAAQYAKNRKIKSVKGATMSRHIQVESGMSMTGSNADNRILVKPSEQGAAIATLYNEVAGLAGGSKVSAPNLNAKATKGLTSVAKELVANKGKSLVISGSNNVGEQLLVNKINDLLGSYGSTISFEHASMQRQGLDKEVQNLIKEMENGSVDALIVMDACNPVFDLPNGAQFAAAMDKVGLKVSCSGLNDDTTNLCNYVAPTHNFLESWGDAEPKRGHYSLIQPTISPLFDTRNAEVSLLTWANSTNLDKSAEQPYYEYLKSSWQSGVFANQSSFATFQAFWDTALHDGVLNTGDGSNGLTSCNVDVNRAASLINKPSASEMEVSFYESITIGAGQYSNNPWLQEVPDPVTRTTWGNYVSVPVLWDGNDYKGYLNIGANQAKGKAEVVEVNVGDSTGRFTAVPQFGQMPGTCSIALGYGRAVVGAAGKNVGTNVQPWLSLDANGNTKYYGDLGSLKVVGTDNEFACVQYHHTMGITAKDESGEYLLNPKDAEKRLNVDEVKLAFQGSLVDRSVIFNSNLEGLEEKTKVLQEKREYWKKDWNEQTLYGGHKDIYKNGHHWGMMVDLNACTGCNACAVACMAENNVPVVGKREVSRHHEMTWLRIDRYFYGDIESPSVVYQPMMCQHCDNAPCENVCPVAATNHSSEGLNQMTYNRCIGTRYCANNCPYKVRRFNWYDYTTADLFPGNQYTINGEEVPFGADNLTRMVLNPDVTVRSRGVIEKCSFCVQRIQEGKLTAKREGRHLMDSDVRTACQTACPTGAIVFGDDNNPKGDLVKKLEEKKDLIYRVIEETNTDSSVKYTMKVNNRSEDLDKILS